MHSTTDYNTLAQRILQTYTARFNELDDAHKFHFASRLYHWTQSEWSRNMLDAQRHILLPSTDESEVIALLQHTIASGNTGLETINASEQRTPYFEKYADLRGTTFALFKLRHWLTCYDHDARELFTKNVTSGADLQSIQDAVFSDLPAVSVLSTHAINFYYLKNRLIEQNNAIPKDVIDHTLQLYDLSNKQDILLYIYLLTHCIIGESLFYVTPIKGSSRDYYIGYMQNMEQLITQHYDDINLDNKCEFLVCAKLLRYSTPQLQERIYTEAVNSIHPDSYYIVDTHNSAKRADRTDINRSEHRNVLCIMAFGDFSLSK